MVQALVQQAAGLARILDDPAAELHVLDAVRGLNNSGNDQAIVLAQLKATSKKMESNLLRRSRLGFQDWIGASLRIGAGALHKYTKQFGEPRPSLAAVNIQGAEVTEPLQVINAKVAYWSDLWNATENVPQEPGWWAELRRRARLQEHRQVHLEDLRQALKCFRPQIGQGGDKTNPRWWLQLPDEGLQQLAHLLEQIEQEVTWPAAVQENVIQLIPKDQVSDRPIALTQALYRPIALTQAL